MPTIGDLIFSTRSKIPDLPGSLPAPAATAIPLLTTSTLPTGTYNLVVTQRNPWGETLPSTEITGVVVGAGQGIQVTSALLPGATAIRAYLTLPGGAAGSEIQYVESTSSPFNIVAPLTGFGTPPTRGTAWLLDSDGPQFSAGVVYQWMNEGLNELIRITGGMLDYCGVPTVQGQSMYVTPGQWKEISDVWYGGYWVQGGRRSEFFRRNTVTTSVLNAVTVSVYTDKQVIEVSYQPDRTSGVTATTANMSTFDTSVPLGNTGVFLLPFGFLQIGNEICAYATLANGQATGLIRGLGNTVATAWPSGTPVVELSLFWCGKRTTITPYQPGSSLMNLAAPQGWVAILPLYMLAQAKKSELDLQSAKELEDDFKAKGEAWLMANKPVARFVQVGGSTNVITFDDVLGNGIVIPN